MALPRYKAIFFDLDGTIIDSMPYLHESVRATFAEYSTTLDSEFMWQWHGNRLPMTELLSHHGLQHVSIDEFRGKFVRLFSELVQSKVEWVNGAEEVLHILKQRGIPTAVITNAPRKYVDGVHNRIGLMNLCNFVITPEDAGGKPKPNPDGLLLAARKLGKQPAECLYIGDQIFDMLAAKNACLPSAFIRSEHSVDGSSYSTYVFASLTDVLEYAKSPLPNS